MSEERSRDPLLLPALLSTLANTFASPFLPRTPSSYVSELLPRTPSTATPRCGGAAALGHGFGSPT